MFTPPLKVSNVIKTTLFFRDPGSGLAWSESYIPIGATSVDEVHDDSIKLMVARSNINAWPIVNTAIRISNESIQRDAYLLIPGPNTFEAGGQTETFGGTADPAEMSYSTVLVREQATSLYHSQRYVSGIPDSAIVDPPGPAMNNVFGANWLKWQNTLYGNFGNKNPSRKWGFIVLSKDPLDRVPQPILAFAKPLGAYTFTVASTAGYSVGDVVKMYGAKFVGNVTQNGYMLVLSADNATKQIVVQPPAGSSFDIVQGGRLERLVRIPVTYTSYEIRGETHRKRGGRFFLPRGKSPNRG